MLPRSVLIANRGEIAVRVERTCRRLGIRTVAVYSDADAGALHVALADAAVRIGPPPPSESYLRIGAILDAASREGAEAVHPGYGFLAENPDFAQACLDAGLVWVGPSPAAMRRLGDKAQARALAQELGVPVLPGLALDDVDRRLLPERAAAIGLPLLIKASAGGGGRGMRLVQSLDELDVQLEAARREARASFGDDRLLLERFVPHARHVEAQLLGDAGGRLLVLGERECSIQRRNQKLIEETPSPAVDSALRSRLVDTARTLGHAVDYTSAGTVEFVLDQQGAFAFLEVNTRLQVEHPVTEMVTGLDLVELQLRVAAGESLPPELAELAPIGHAIEARVVAEDPLLGFVPSTGRIETFDLPAYVRVDSGVRAGDLVSTAYDSLLAKVIVAGRDRAGAVDALADALRQCRVRGVQTNLDLLLAVVETPAFRDGALETGFLQEHHVLARLAEVPSEALAAAAAADFFVPQASDDPWRQLRPWRLGRLGQPSRWRLGAREWLMGVTFEPDSARPRVTVAGATHQVTWLGSDGQGVGQAHVDGRLATVRDLLGERQVGWLGRSYRLERAPPPSVEAAGPGGGRGTDASGVLTAPMPGRVLGRLGGGRRRRRRRPDAGRPGGNEDGAHHRGATRRRGEARRRRGASAGSARRAIARTGRGHSMTRVALPGRVRLIEVGPRDGLQNEPVDIPTEAKVHFVDLLSAAGCGTIEVTSFVHPRAVPRMADADRVLPTIEHRPGTRYVVLVPNPRGLERALAAGAREIALFTAATESFARANINRTIAESLEDARAVIDASRPLGRARAGVHLGRLRLPVRRSGEHRTRWRWWPSNCSSAAPTRSVSATRSAWPRRPTSTP